MRGTALIVCLCLVITCAAHYSAEDKRIFGSLVEYSTDQEAMIVGEATEPFADAVQPAYGDFDAGYERVAIEGDLAHE